jgi:tetratricopeptide (TPR) repeat protein
VGEILVQLSRIESAVAKYNWIARTYLARDNRDRATEVLSEIIKAAPMDVSVRMNLIELYEEYEEWDKLLPEYIYLGDAYMNLSDTASARETYNHAIMIAKRLQAPPPVIAEIMHKVVDMEMLRLDLRSAMRTCEQIKQIHPEDRKARELLVDIHYRMGNTGPALNELDALLQFYTAQKDGKAILETLQFWVKQRPDDEAIRSRIAAIYHQIRQYNRALEHYNHLLQLQLNNGRHADACKTISTVLTLNPPHKEKYQQLGKQLGCL